MLAADRVRKLLDYDPISGEFVWKSRSDAPRWNGKYAGKLAGRIDNHGYRQIGLGGKFYRAHRLAWLYVHGEWPSAIDHIDGNRRNNAISNLRLATIRQNRANTGCRGRSGLKGAFWVSHIGKWRARISIKGKKKHIGVFGTAEEASRAYDAAAQEVYGEFARVKR